MLEIEHSQKDHSEVIFDFNSLRGDSFLDKLGSVAIQMIRLMEEELGGYEDCFVLTNLAGSALFQFRLPHKALDANIFDNEEYPKGTTHIGWMHYINSPIFINSYLGDFEYKIVKTHGWNPLSQSTITVKVINFN